MESRNLATPPVSLSRDTCFASAALLLFRNRFPQIESGYAVSAYSADGRTWRHWNQASVDCRCQMRPDTETSFAVSSFSSRIHLADHAAVSRYVTARRLGFVRLLCQSLRRIIWCVLPTLRGLSFPPAFALLDRSHRYCITGYVARTPWNRFEKILWFIFTSLAFVVHT